MFCSLSLPTYTAYRLASIGLVGNLQVNLSGIVTRDGLPIGFDRIGWKQLKARRPCYKQFFHLLTDWLRSDWLETRHSSCGHRRIRALPIGFDRIGWKPVGEGDCWNHYDCLPIGFDRIGWKPSFGYSFRVPRFHAYRLASIGLVGNIGPLEVQVQQVQAYRLASIGLVGNKPTFNLRNN